MWVNVLVIKFEINLLQHQQKLQKKIPKVLQKLKAKFRLH